MTTGLLVVAAVVTCILVATAVALLLLHALGLVVQGDRRRVVHPMDALEAEFRATRQAMNDAAGQSWRNVLD